MGYLLAPSILSADFGKLEKDILMLNRSQADWIHVDVMDGTFVPNISFGFPVLKSVTKVASKPLDVHLMITKPERYIQEFADVGADLITIHYEAGSNIVSIISLIKETGKKAGLALSPDTPVSVVEGVIDQIDLLLIMSVHPGFPAQKFIPETIEKVHQAKKLISEKKPDTLIEVDGGINLDNAGSVLNAGADMLVAGNAVFATENPVETISTFKKLG